MRERRAAMLLGSQGSGKTTLGQRFVSDARARGVRVKGLSPNGSMGFSFPGTAAGAERWLEERRAAGDADMLVFDDADRYIPKTPRDESVWHHLWLMNRHFHRRNVGVDVIVIGRRAQNFSGEVHSGIDRLYLFQLAAGDVHGTKRLMEIAPGIVLPDEPFRFLVTEPKSANAAVKTGRTFADGTYELHEALGLHVATK